MDMLHETSGLRSISFVLAVAAALAAGCSGGNGAAGKLTPVITAAIAAWAFSSAVIVA